MFRYILFAIILCCQINLVSAQNIIPLGKGSYSQTPPAYKAGRYDLFPWPDSRGEGDKAYSMVYDREYFVVEGNDRPIPTNDWLTSLFKNQFSGELWAYPMILTAESYGVKVEYPHTWNADGTHMVSASELSIKGVDFTATAALAQNWGDWTIDFILPSDKQNMTVTLGHGLPFVWVEIDSVLPYIEGEFDAFFDDNGNAITFPIVTDHLGVEIAGDNYGIFAPTGTQFEIDGNKLLANMPEDDGYIVVSALPAKSQLLQFYTYAYVIPRDSRVDYNYIEEDGKLFSSWNLITENLKGDAELNAIQGFIPHHYRTTELGFEFTSTLEYSTPRGLMKSAIGNSFSIDYKFNGLLPVFPKPEDYGVDNAFDSTMVKQGISNFTTNTIYGSDTYWGAKDLVMKSQYALIAKTMDMEEESVEIQENLVTALADWYTFDPGETDYCFTYYPNWGAMVGFNSSYFSDEFTDHHFHYGYFSLATGMLGLINKSFIEDYGPMAKLVASDYANWKRDDDMLPYFRTFDIWAGHSYAGGLPDGGNGQESTSEAMQSWGGLFMLAMATKDYEMRDAAIFGYVSEAQGTAEYWYDRYKVNPEDDFPARNNIPASYDKPYNSNLESGGIGYWNWFSGNMGFNHAIQWIPWSPIMKYFSEDPEFTQWDHDYVLEHWVNNPDGWATETDYYNGWAGMASIDILSAANPEAAVAVLQECRDNGLEVGTDALRHYNVHSPRTYGEVDWSRYIDYPLGTVYYKESTGQYTYVVFNAENTERTFNVYSYDDGLVASFKAPAGKLTTYQGYAELTSIEISSEAITVPVGETLAFSAQGYDQYEATIDATYTWQVTGGGTINSEGVFTATTLGEYELTAASGEVEKTIQIRVGDSPVISDIIISAESYIIEQETEMQFTAVAVDQYGDNYSMIPAWTVTGGGEIDATSGLFKAGTDLGIFTLTVSADGFTKDLDVQVRIPLINVALGKTAYASSQENGAYPPEEAVDGIASFDSRWSSAHADDQYFAVDLGGSFNIDYINIIWQDAFASEYEVYATNDEVDISDAANQAWGTPIYSTTSGSAGQISIDVYNEFQYFYVKCIARGTEWGFSIMEFEAYGFPVSGAEAQLTSIQILPSYPEISDLDSIQLSAVGYDQYGAEVAIVPEWSMLDNSQGTVTSDGWFKPAEWARGLITLKALSDNVLGFGQVIVQPSYNKVAAIEIVPVSDEVSRVNVAQGMAYKFDALVKNQFYWNIEGEITWSITGGGTMNQNGYFTASTLGDFEIYASCQGIIDTAFISVTSIDGVNIALNKPATASSVEGENTSEKAVDGSGATRWASAWVADAEWEVNLQAIYNLTQIEIDWEPAYADQYSIEVSTDGENWTTAFTQNACAGGTEIIDASGFDARYIKVVCIDRHLDAYGYSFYELRAYASGMVNTPELSTIDIVPGRSWISNNTPFEFQAIAYDQFGDVFATDIDWSVSGAGNIDENGLYTPDKAGNYYINASSGSVSSSAKVTVLGDPVVDINQKPVCAVSAPSSGRVVVNEELSIQATAIDYDGEITNLEFYVDGLKIGEVNTYPYSINWTPTEEKEYEIHVIAFDDLSSATSSVLKLRSVASISAPLLVLTSPSSSEAYIDQQIVMAAEALYFQETIQLVEFYINGIKYAEDLEAPYTADWTPTTEDDFQIYAIATDEVSNTYSTDTILVTVGVNEFPIVELSEEIADSVEVNTTVSMGATASDADGSITQVEFYIDGSLVGTDMEAPYSIDWTPTVTGDYELYATAYDNKNASTQSLSKTIVVVEEQTSFISGRKALTKASVYPNPARNNIFINTDGNYKHYAILNISGEIVKSGQLSPAKQINLSVDDLGIGVYYVQLLSDKSSTIYKFVKD